MTYHWVVHSKMKPIDVDELFNRKSSSNGSGSTLKVNEPINETVVSEETTE